jgi:hypothetical protein
LPLPSASRFASAIRAPFARKIARQEDRRIGDLLAIARAQRFDEVPRLHVRGREQIDDGEPEGSRVHGVDASSIFGPHLVGYALLDLQAHRAGPEAINDEPEQCAQPRARRLDPDFGEDTMDRHRPLVDAAGRKKLLGRRALEVQALGRGSLLCGLHVDPSGVCAPSCPLEDFAQTHAQSVRIGRCGRGALQRRAQELHRPIERELGNRLPGSALRVRRGPLRLARAEQMGDDRLGIGARRRLEDSC